MAHQKNNITRGTQKDISWFGFGVLHRTDYRTGFPYYSFPCFPLLSVWAETWKWCICSGYLLRCTWKRCTRRTEVNWKTGRWCSSYVNFVFPSLLPFQWPNGFSSELFMSQWQGFQIQLLQGSKTQMKKYRYSFVW